MDFQRTSDRGIDSALDTTRRLIEAAQGVPGLPTDDESALNDAWLKEAALKVPRAYGKSRTCSAAERGENHLLLDQLNALVEEVHEIINRQMAGSAPPEQCANVAAQVDGARHRLAAVHLGIDEALRSLEQVEEGRFR